MWKVLGLDVGIASVGWCIIDTEHNRVVDMGVRLFDSADVSNNVARREARSSRRVIRRKKYRLKSIGELLRENGFDKQTDNHYNPYELRVRGLREQLSEEELYVALYHLAKRRGVSYLDDIEDEDAKVNEYLEINRDLLKTKHPCEIQLERLEKYGKVRGIVEIENLEGENESLINVFTTESYKNEALDILNQQRKYYSQINDKFIEEYINILTRKRDYYVGPGDELNRTNYGIYKTDGRIIDSIFEELIGRCNIYHDEQRAPGASYTAQEFNLLNDLNNLIVAGRKLTEEEKREIIEEILNTRVKSFTSARVLKTIKKVAKLEDESEIKGYRIDKKEKPEFHTFEAERKLRLYLEDTSIDYSKFDINQKDKLAEILSLSMDYKTLNEKCKKEFPKFSQDDIKLLYDFLQSNKKLYSLNKWHSFSLKLMREMREELYSSSKNQMNYLTDKGLIKDIQDSFEGYKYIPADFLNDKIYNPVVRRSVNQAIKIINAILKKYGDLEAIIIEMPRETNEQEKKQKITEMQRNNEKEKNEALNRIRNEYPVTEDQLYRQPGILKKIRLWYQQDGNCIYTGKVISVQDLINNPDKFEIDHIIPKSVSLDDGLNNEVLVYAYANQIKGKRTPFNAFSFSNVIKYEDIKLRALNLFKKNKINKTKYELLTFEEDINKYEVRERFINRNLVDTRYASRVILNGLQQYMSARDKDTKIHVVRGKFTHQIRKKWGLEKDRDESFAHHGIDAAIIAASYMLGQSDETIRNPFLQSIGKYNKEFWKVKDNKEFDKEVYSLPWEGFIRDLNEAEKNIKYSHKIDTKVNRKISDATIYSTREVNGEDFVVKKYKDIYNDSTAKLVISKINDDLKKFDNPSDSMILMRKHDPQTFEIILKIMKEYEGEKPNPFEAYRRENGYIRKYSKKGNGPIIKDIKYLEDRLGQSILISKTKALSTSKKVVLLQLESFRTDVYYSNDKKEYRNVDIKYSDLKFERGVYLLDLDRYFKKKEELGIGQDFNFIFSLHKNDLVGIRSAKSKDILNLYRFVSSRSDNPNKIKLKPINCSKFSKENPLIIGDKKYSSIEITINKSIYEFNKYHTDILGRLYVNKGEKLKLDFKVDNINDM